MKAHLNLAHFYWKQWVSSGDTVIDATMGNGHDTFFLAQLLNGKGRLIGYDIQAEAIEQTKARLQTLSESERAIVSLQHKSHIFFSEKEVKLIVYNLGYLPGGDKSATTKTENTLKSLKHALEAIGSMGAISITCYPGHPEGAKEEAGIFDFVKKLSSREWNVCYHQWINRPQSPSLFFLRNLG